MRGLAAIVLSLLASHAAAGVQTERLYLSGRGSDSTVGHDKPKAADPVRDPRFTAMAFPDGDVSFLYAIPAVGTKFVRAENHGPQGKRFQASGDYEGTLYFFFGQAPER
jgi:hypothetical protein